MENIDFATLFHGIGTMMASGWVLASARVFLVLLGLLLIYLGWKGILEPMVMIPMVSEAGSRHLEASRYP